MKRTTMRAAFGRTVLLTMFLFAGLMYSTQLVAQDVTPAAPSQLSGKAAQSYDFVNADDAIQILNQEIRQLRNNAGNLNGGSSEAINSAKLAYYAAIRERVSTGDAVGTAILDSHAILLAVVNSYAISVSSTNIVNSALALLST